MYANYFETFFPMPKIITINPNNLTGNPEKIALLRSLLEQERAHVYLENNRYFKLSNQKVCLTHAMLQAPQTPEQPRAWHVIAKTPLGDGGFGDVHAIKSTISFPNEPTIEYASGNSRVVKIQKTDGIDVFEEDLKAQSENEYFGSNKASHLNMAPPLYATSRDTRVLTSFLIMDHMPGKTLESIIGMRFVNNKNISRGTLLQITSAILKAYTEQVYKPELLHGDIKPDNIMIDVDLEPEGTHKPITVNLIDYAFCMTLPGIAQEPPGSKGYAAPEILRMLHAHKTHTFRHEKSDIFSLGVSLKNMWFEPGRFPPPKGQFMHKSMLFEANRHFDFECHAFSSNTLASVFDALTQMTQSSRKARWSLEQTIHAFNCMLETYQTTQLNSEIDESELSSPEQHAPQKSQALPPSPCSTTQGITSPLPVTGEEVLKNSLHHRQRLFYTEKNTTIPPSAAHQSQAVQSAIL